MVATYITKVIPIDQVQLDTKYSYTLLQTLQGSIMYEALVVGMTQTEVFVCFVNVGSKVYSAPKEMYGSSWGFRYLE